MFDLIFKALSDHPNVRVTFSYHEMEDDIVVQSVLADGTREERHLGPGIVAAFSNYPMKDYATNPVLWDSIAGGNDGCAVNCLGTLQQIFEICVDEVQLCVDHAVGQGRHIPSNGMVDDAEADIYLPDWKEETYLHIAIRGVK